MSEYDIISFPGSHLPRGYVNMIFAKWLRSFKYGNDYFRLMDNDAYFKNYSRQVSWILNQADCSVRLAVLHDDHDVCLGFCVYRDTILDYIHVQRDMRNIGIGTALMPEGIKVITHITKYVLEVWHKSYPEVRFNPFT